MGENVYCETILIDAGSPELNGTYTGNTSVSSESAILWDEFSSIDHYGYSNDLSNFYVWADYLYAIIEYQITMPNGDTTTFVIEGSNLA